MMASDDKKTKTNPAPKNEAPPENKSTSGVDPSKAEGGEIAAALPSGYSRGEGQKPVSKAYKDNWNVIFAKKNSDNSRNGAGVSRSPARSEVPNGASFNAGNVLQTMRISLDNQLDTFRAAQGS